MSPAGSLLETIPVPAVDFDDLFNASSYTDWAKATMQAKAPMAEAAVLFESTISEPTPELVEVIRHAFSLQVTDRFVSVFSGGNPFVVDVLCRRYGVAPDQVITTTGSTSALAMTIKALTRRGDRILVERPGFDIFASLAHDAGAMVDDLPRPGPSFKVDLRALELKLSLGARMVVMTNLHNPSGTWVPPEDVREIAATCARFGAVLVVDEVYGDFARDVAPEPAAALGPNIVSVNSLTKVFGLFSLKCGWLIAQPALTQRIRDAVPDGDMGVSKLSHAIAAHVLEQADVFDAHWKRILSKTAPVLRAKATAMVAEGLLVGEVPPYGCMYFPRVVGVDDTRALAQTLWTRFGLLVAPGEYFGTAGHIRIGFGADSPEFPASLERLHRALQEIRS